MSGGASWRGKPPCNPNGRGYRRSPRSSRSPTVGRTGGGNRAGADAGVGSGGGGLARADLDGAPLGAGVTAVFVGPEGGWSEHERAVLPPAVALGPHVLRAETAAIVAGVLLVARHR